MRENLFRALKSASGGLSRGLTNGGITSEERVLAVVTGAGGVIGKSIVNEIANPSNPNLLVIGGTRSQLNKGQIEKNKEHGRFYQDATIDYSRLGLRRFFHEVKQGVYGPVPDRIKWINTIGGGHPQEGQSVIDLNVSPVQALCAEAKKFSDATGINFSIAHLSSHTTAVTPKGLEPYTDSRYMAEEEILNSGLPSLILRLGIVINSPKLTTETNGKRIAIFDTKYDFSPERNAKLPLIPIVGGFGKMPLQYVHADDVAVAINNGFIEKNINKSIIVNAVSGDMATQAEISRTMADLSGKPYRPVDIPL